MGNRDRNYFDDPENRDGGSSVGAPSTTATKEQFAAYLTNGFWNDFYGTPGDVSDGWNKNNFTYSIASYYSAAEKEGIRDAFQQWADVTNITFTELSSGGDIPVVGPAHAGEQGRAFASNQWSPTNGIYYITGTRIVIDYDSGGFGTNPSDLGDYALMTAIHEIGHALGLGHTGNYNAGQGNPTYANNAQWINDTRQYSLMSYWSASSSGASHQGEYASTPLVMDIYAVQQLYGANMSVRSGNTIYGFNSTANSDQFNFTVNVRPVVAIWDGGGNDTIDVSGWSMAQMINLADGAFSNVGGGIGNLAIAYNAIIENATGGSGNDTIYGNSANNILLGNNGNDTFHASTGSDTLNGGAGTDTANYSTYNISAFLVTLVNATTLTLQHIAQSWIDTIIQVENFIFSNVTYTFAQMQNLFDIDDMGIRFDYPGGLYNFTSDSSDTTTLTAATMGYNGASGDMFSVERSGTNLDITVLNASAPDKISIWATTESDTITVSGTHATLGVVFYGKDGDDVLTIDANIAGDSTLAGDNGDDTIASGSGHDTIWGGRGNDILRGGLGNDLIYGDFKTETENDGDDTLDGGAGDDTLVGGAGGDTLIGGSGNDRLFGNSGLDTVDYSGDISGVIVRLSVGQATDGWGGRDTISGVENIIGSDYNDRLEGDSNNNDINGGEGDDLIYGWAGDDTLYGENGRDILYGGDGDDLLYGGDGDDTLSGDAGNDTLYGEAGNDKIWGHSGNDTLYGGDGDDLMYGDSTVETIGDGNDILYGGNGNDTLAGLGGNDTLYGEAGNDKLYGHSGDDILIGGAGADSLWGGTGADTFVFDSFIGVDAVNDFSLGQGDKLDISSLISGYYTDPLSQAIEDFVRITTNGSHSIVSIDQNGGGNSFVHVATIYGVTGLTDESALLASGTLIAV
jgi:Ca2+-binding RTX toxin-like protein